jgi:predicted nucleic acid-binding protein
MGDQPLLASVFVACELQAGALLSSAPERELRNLEVLLENITLVYPDESFPVAYAEAEVELRRNGTPIPTMDLLIGVMAKMRGIPLLTRDAEHYRRIPGLVVKTY